MSASSAGGGGVTLPSYDPWAGDPAELDAIVAKLVRREDRVSEIRIGIVRLLNDPAVTTWLGKSADAFRKTLNPLDNLLYQMADAYNQAAKAARAYAQALREGQASFAKTQSLLQAQVATNPANADGRGGAAALLAVEAHQASSEHDRAKRTCANELASADTQLRVVKAALADERFADFTKTFIGFHGDLGDLAGLQHLGENLATAQFDALRATLDGTDGALPPDQFRALVQDMVDQYGDTPDFWLTFGPLLGRIPTYFSQHDKTSDGSFPPEDQALLTLLGQVTAKAAAAGRLNFLIADTSSADLMGLGPIIAAGGGQAFGNGPGAQFLADLVTKLTLTPPTGQDGSNPTAYGTVLLQLLQAAAQNGDAARIALSGDKGRQLALQILKDSTPLKSVIYVDGQGNPWTTPPLLGGDGSIVHSFLDAALLHGDSRTNSPADQQSVVAAYNVVHATVDYKAWDPTDYKSSTMVYKQGLPVNVNNGLIDYANTYMFDLGRSLDGNNLNEGIGSLGSISGHPLTFYVPYTSVQDFLAFVLADPHAAGQYLGNAQAQLTHAMALAMKGGSGTNYTADYASLVAETQKLIDSQNLSAAQHKDAIATSRLTLFNSLAGVFADAPGGNVLGVAQMMDGLLQPTATGGIFDTGHAQSVLHDNSLNDLYLNHMGRVLAAQAAVEAGLLDPSTLPPGIVDNNNVVIPGVPFQSWYDDNKDMIVGSKSLSDYADKLSKAIGEQVAP